MSDVKTEFLFDLNIDIDRELGVDVGATPHGGRRIVYVKSGTIEGPKIKGVVLPGGGDWAIFRPDGVTMADVRWTARTDDGHIIYTRYHGIVIFPPDEVMQRMRRGEVVDPSEFYFRITPVFETASEKYSWLNRIVAVGIGRITPTGVGYKVYAIL